MTLSEIIIASLLFIILMGIGSTWINNQQEERETQLYFAKLNHFMQFARSHAIRHQCPITIELTRQGLLAKQQQKTLQLLSLPKVGRLDYHGFNSFDGKIMILPSGITHNQGHFSLQGQQWVFNALLRGYTRKI